MRTSPVARVCAVVLAAILSLSLWSAAASADVDEPVVDDRTATSVQLTLHFLGGRHFSLSAYVKGGTTATPVTGELRLYEGATLMGSATAGPEGDGLRFSSHALFDAGVHTIRAEYSGDATYAPSDVERTFTARKLVGTLGVTSQQFNLAAQEVYVQGTLSVPPPGASVVSREATLTVKRGTEVIFTRKATTSGGWSFTVPASIGESLVIEYGGNADVESARADLTVAETRRYPTKLDGLRLETHEGTLSISGRVTRADGSALGLAGGFTLLVDGVRTVFLPARAADGAFTGDPIPVGHGPKSVTLGYNGDTVFASSLVHATVVVPGLATSLRLEGAGKVGGTRPVDLVATEGSARRGVGVVFDFRPAGSTTWRTVARVVTNGFGQARAAVAALGHGAYRARVVPTHTFQASTSAAVQVRVARSYDARCTRRYVRGQRYARISCVAPPAGRAYVERLVAAGRWRTLRTVRFGRSFTVDVKRHRIGRTLRVRVPADSTAGGVTLRVYVGGKR